MSVLHRYDLRDEIEDGAVRVAIDEDLRDDSSNPVAGWVVCGLKNVFFPVGTVYSTTSDLSPTALLGFGDWKKLEKDNRGVSRWERTA